MGGRIEENKLKKKMYRAHTIIAKNIRMLRILNGYTQNQLCDFLHMSRTAYFHLENGCKLMDYKTLHALSEFYGINLDYIISFDMAQQMLTLICVNQDEMSAPNFMDKYFMLSYSGQQQIRQRITELQEFERTCNIFPWNYEKEAK